jgi:hypothetical protein
MDFGFMNYFAAVELAWDRDHDVVYLIRTYRQKETTPIIHASVLRHWRRELQRPACLAMIFSTSR